MKLMLFEVRNQLLKNSYINDMTKISEDKFRVKAYEYPETADKSGAFITIRPVDVPNEAYHGSDKELSVEHLIQIDVEAVYPSVCKELQFNAKQEMRKLGFGQVRGQGLDEYFSETRRFVDSRRYRGNTKIYDTDY
ncbi:hypothetical protein [Enterococcus sp. AZ007]|uniref:hypothetical protein n=1 Tax=Enterococcus sp. AZ007 TaxID=2774839 RepID=UPI003F1EE373